MKPLCFPAFGRFYFIFGKEKGDQIMKVLLINGSPNEQGCTNRALTEVAEALHREGVETEIFHIGNRPVWAATAATRA